MCAARKFIHNSFFDYLTDSLLLKAPVKVKSGVWGDLYTFDFSEKQERHCFFLSLCLSDSLPQIVSELLSSTGAEDIVVVASAPVGHTSLFRKKNWWSKVLREFAGSHFNVSDRFALNPDPQRPQIIFDLQKHILAYVEIISHRCLDSFFKYATKKAKIGFCGTSSWNSWEVIVLQRGEVVPALPQISDRYLLLTPDREVGLVFAQGKKSPVFVEKKGDQVLLGKEWENQKWAYQRLGSSVPSVFEFSLIEERAILKMEYIPERNLLNIVAESFFKQRCLQRQTLLLLEFYQSVFTRFLNAQDLQKNTLDTTIQKVILDGLNFIFSSDQGGIIPARLEDALNHLTVPLVPQHGDFCVRNVLYRNTQEMVLIDWEDFYLSSLPLIDLQMLQVSLEEIWTEIDGLGESRFYKQAAVQKTIAELTSDMQERLDLAGEDWLNCSFLSLAFLTGNNIRKSRKHTAGRLRDAFLRQLARIEF